MGVALVGCASSPRGPDGPPPLYIDAADYPQAFGAAKDLARECEFELDRVDARAGVITTQPLISAGLATPWIPHSGSVAGSVQGLIQHERRSATIRFLPAGSGDAPPPELFDFRDFEGQVEIVVEVELQRVHRPHRRPSIASIRLTSFAENPATADPERDQQFSIETLRDEDLARRMTERLRRGLAPLGSSDPAD